MLRRFSAFLLLSALAWPQSTIPGCANRPASSPVAPETAENEKVGLKQRVKDQFGSGWCGSVLGAGGCQKEKEKAPEPTPSPSPSSHGALDFPEEQSRKAEEEANAKQAHRNPNESSSRDVDAGPSPGEIEVMEMKKFDPHKAEKDVEVGDFYYKRQNYRAAASRYKEAVDLKPAYPIATFKLADALEKSKQFDDAAVYYREYIRDFPAGEQAAAARDALARIAPNVKADPARLIQEQVTRDMKAGETFLASRNYPDAINRFCDVAAAQPTNARGFFRLAQSLQQVGEFPSAYADYSTYLKLEPDGPFADDARTEMQRLRPQLQGSVTSPSAGTRP